MRRAVIVLAAGCSLAAGCRMPSLGPYPPDPLVIANKPLEAAPRPTGLLPPLAVVEPAPPPIPDDTAFAIHQTRYESEAPSPACRTIAHRTEPPPGEPEYGSGPGMRWLRGTLEKGSDGRFELCYRKAALDAPAGKVRLEDDPLLSPCADGEAVRVEGVLVPSRTPTAPTAEAPPPRYKLTALSRPSAAL